MDNQVREAEQRLAQVKADLANGTEYPQAEAAKLQELETLFMNILDPKKKGKEGPKPRGDEPKEKTAEETPTKENHTPAPKRQRT